MEWCYKHFCFQWCPAFDGWRDKYEMSPRSKSGTITCVAFSTMDLQVRRPGIYFWKVRFGCSARGVGVLLYWSCVCSSRNLSSVDGVSIDSFVEVGVDGRMLLLDKLIAEMGPSLFTLPGSILSRERSPLSSVLSSPVKQSWSDARVNWRTRFLLRYDEHLLVRIRIGVNSS